MSREAGSRAKITVLSKDPGIDPVGACVGMRGSRVQAVVGELQGEKVEIIPYTEEPAAFVVNALAPAEVAKVVMDEVAGRMEVVVPDDQLSLAIGRRGQNVRLASQLSGWYIDSLTEAESQSAARKSSGHGPPASLRPLTSMMLSHICLLPRVSSCRKRSRKHRSRSWQTFKGLIRDIAAELQNRAVEYVEQEAQRINKALDGMMVSDDLRSFEYISLACC